MSTVERDNVVIAKKVQISNSLVMAGTEVTATAAELNLNDGIGASATHIVGAEAANTINVAVQLKDANAVNVAVRQALPWYLASDSTGATPSASAPATSTLAGTNGKIILWTAKLSGLMIFDASGRCDINIIETGVATWYLVVVLPDGKLSVSGAITFA